MHTEDHHDSYKIRITRRHALQAIAQFPIQMYGLTLFSAGKQALPAPEEVLPACAAGLTACLELRQYEPEGLFTIRRTLAAYLPALEHFASQSSPSQRDAAHLASQSYLLASMITEQFGKYDQMEAACNLARLYGQLAQDPNLEVAALTRLAVHSAYRNRDNKALETYQEASALPGFARTSPLLRGRVYAGLAGMSACCGQSQEALSFLSKAREVFPQHAENDPSFRFAYCVQSHLALWEGITYKHTGYYGKAVAALRLYGSLTPVPGQLELYRAEHLNYAASVAIMQRDLDAACLYLDTAEDVARSIRHEQRQAEARDTLRGMQLLWPHEPKVMQLREKMLAR